MNNHFELIEIIIEALKKKAFEFGAKVNNEYSKDYVLRRNIKPDAFENNGAYFGFIHPEEETSGPYHDFSFVVFPSNPQLENVNHWVVSLVVGSLGFRNDYELSTFPGVRRLFCSMIDNNDSFCKSDFSDIETSVSKNFLDNEKIGTIRKTLETYKKVLSSCQIIEKPKIKTQIEENEKENYFEVEYKDKKFYVKKDKSYDVLIGFLAAYAKLRNWASNNRQRRAISESINKIKRGTSVFSEEDIEKLLLQRKYIILEGAPGTGKTRMAQKLAENMGAQTVFTQFHAETSYSDFIWGLRPKLNSETVIYEEVKGSFVIALETALKLKKNGEKQKVFLIIDEINRANLSNILGPIFYLFEYQREKNNIEIEITPQLKISSLPKNFYVIATMNTADRSLAVVDFALRRRFAWITLKPQIISPLNKREKNKDSYKISEQLFFYKKDFEQFDDIFQWYAQSNELNLQPGQAYFLARNDEEMENRIKLELFPLIKEYIQEGMLLSAKEEFNSYFQSRIGKSLFE